MKGDFSRQTFDRAKHYSGVRMQQGRVQIDADWNEQSAIIGYRAETGLLDVIGGCGGPVRRAGFRLVASAADLTAEEQKLPQNAAPVPKAAPGDLLITGGRYYVEGALAENERIVPISKQPDLPPLPGVPILDKEGVYVAYLDLWDRHLTALEDPSIREVALGGPDTATRVKTVWQVKLWYGGEKLKEGCRDPIADFDAAIAPGTGMLSARTKPAGPNVDPCIVPPGAGFRGLENQLYRVEIHSSGSAIDPAAGTPVTVNAMSLDDAGLQQITLATKVTWTKGQAFEIFPTATGSDPMAGTLAFLESIDGTGKILLLAGGAGGISMADAPKVRTVGASYKWSRDNGSVVTTIEKIDGDEITVHDLGPDAVLGFAPEQWVELSDDLLELHGLPGQLAQIRSIDPARRIITLRSPVNGLAGNPEGVDPLRHPKLRRWDGVGAIKAGASLPADAGADLEDGVQVRFTSGTYRTGDYWTIPARTATTEEGGNIEWPKAPGTGTPLDQPPAGIRHRYCRIAMIKWDGSKAEIDDCRCLFSPLTRIGGFFYVGGDGQEARPGQPMPQPLQVGLFNAGMLNNCAPVAGSSVRFSTQSGGRLAANIAGLPAGSNNLIVPTDSAGIASVAWQLDPSLATPSQTVEARLLNPEGVPLPQVIFFHGNLSIAAEVAYDPKKCRNLEGVKTVEEALDEICRQLGQSGNCHPFLDELRSDGVIRIPSRKPGEKGRLSLGVRRAKEGGSTEGGPTRVRFDAGIAYASGCRHVIDKSGEIDVDPNAVLQWVVVNALGVVVVMKEPLPPPNVALLAAVSTREGEVERIVDLRRDLTHLDEQLERTRHEVAGARRDARAYVPLLAGTIRDLKFRNDDGFQGFRDGRNHAFDTPTLVTSLVFDGESIWFPSFQKQQLMRIDRYETDISKAEAIEAGLGLFTGCFDGTSVWFTSPFPSGEQKTTSVVAIDIATHEIRTIQIPGIPMSILFDGDFIWVTTSDNMTLVQIDVNINQIVRIVPFGSAVGPGSITGGSGAAALVRPLALEFDGEFIWISGTLGTLFRLKKPFGALEAVPITRGGNEISSDAFNLAFDGSHLWMLQLDGNIRRLDVLTRRSALLTIRGKSQAIRSILFDGSYMWLLQDDPEIGRELIKVDARTGVALGSLEFPRLPLTAPAFPMRLQAFDGTHYWYPYKPAPGGEDPDNKAPGFQKLLIA